ncbi:MAG: Type 1 glutamine amidotransferase-like domain-containing protein [Acidobacteria bacterium]|nr:Type 1 glutamine amidotransferase-like domain-containing protein [Acidobacteriota bacterium]
MLKPEPARRRVLLLSSSYLFGYGYLDFAEHEIRDFLDGVRSVLFVPYAMSDHDAYAAKARERFGRMGYEIESVHDATVPAEAVRGAEAVFVGGGNTFRLLTAGR